jgi:transcriptional regulator with GAF, ATPase, and Fis domain
MARLSIKEGPGRGTVYELVDDAITIGRDPINVIQIPSETVSRTHAVVAASASEDEEGWTIKDMRSKNGLFVNGTRLKEAALESGDEIRLGEAVLTFVLKEFDELPVQALGETEAELHVRDVLKKEDIIHRPEAARATAGMERNPRVALMALLDLSTRAGDARSYPELFELITDTIKNAIEPHRTVPILFDEKKGCVRPWVSQRGEFDAALSRVPISTTIVNYVQKNRAAILSEAAQEDARLGEAQSIMTHQIASAMCAPLMLGDRLLGALYVDRLGDADRFTKSDLELLTAIAVHAAAAVESVRMRDEMGRERSVREKEARGTYDIVGECDAMKQVFRFISKAAPTDASVLIEGDSGTGKELVARAVHLNSRRRHKPFEAVNCAAMPPALLESELFGHIRGAFTGADKTRAGRFELADGGTLFLDEIGELPESSQAKLLRVIETGVVRRVGDVKDFQVNVRVVAATNRVLADQVKAGAFREDLYFRLNVLKVPLPPLREREGDIEILAAHYLSQFAAKCGRPKLKFDSRVLNLFATHSWPGNVRELKNVIERMVVLADSDTLGLDDVPYELRTGGADTAEIGIGEGGALVTLRDLEKNHIQRIMRHTGGNKKESARILGIDRSTLYAKLKTYQID